MKKLTTLALLALLCAGCNNMTDSALADMAAKPKATTIADAKKLYDEVNALIAYHENPANEKMSPEQLATATALRDKRWSEMTALGGQKVLDAASKIFGGIDLKNIDVGKATDSFIGVNAPEKETFAAPNKADHDRGPTDKAGAKGWP
jgi:hypothetical protein